MRMEGKAHSVASLKFPYLLQLLEEIPDLRSVFKQEVLFVVLFGITASPLSFLFLAVSIDNGLLHLRLLLLLWVCFATLLLSKLFSLGLIIK